ncbi:helix-turn-helix domain-containing protein [Nocardia sp. NPDC003963]
MSRRQRPSLPAHDRDISPLRRARLTRGATLEQVCADLDQRSADGSSGVHPGMLSKWETGVHHTSDKYRELLATYYAQPAEQLFAHQDRHTRERPDPRLVLTYADLHEAMLEVVDGARDYLVVTGSRSRDTAYLQAIEKALNRRNTLVHFRILFGRPRHRTLTEHLGRLIDLRDPADRSLGVKTLHISMIDNPDYPERFFVASEHAAVAPIPSLTSAESFDCGVVLGAAAGTRYIEHARQLYLCGHKLETDQALTELAT